MDEKDRALSLYNLEYEKAADRYDNIYRSIWTIFSYLTAVAAGFLAYGSDKIEPHALIFLAAIPLLFWFWTTYMPLDRYGNEVINCLGKIEGLLNDEFRVKLDHFKRAAHPLKVVGPAWQALKTKNWDGVWKQVHRARFVICLFFIALHVLFIWQIVLYWRSCQPLFLERLTAATQLKPYTT